MTVNDTDKFLVNRSNTSYQIETQNLMAELQDTDLMLVNRGGVSYKATGADIKDSLGPTGFPNKPSIVAPADGAGIEVSAESDEIINARAPYSAWVPTLDEVNAGQKKAVGGVYGKWIDINPSTADMGYGTRYPYLAFNGDVSDSMYWTGSQYPNDGNILSATLDLTELGVINSVKVYGGKNAGSFTPYSYQFLSSTKAALGTVNSFVAPNNSTGEWLLIVPTGAQYLKLSTTGGSNVRLLLHWIMVNSTLLFNDVTTTELQLAGFEGLIGGLSFEAGDAVEQDSGHTPTTSAITNVAGNILTLTNDTDLENFRVGDDVGGDGTIYSDNVTGASNSSALKMFDGDVSGSYNVNGCMAAANNSHFEWLAKGEFNNATSVKIVYATYSAPNPAITVNGTNANANVNSRANAEVTVALPFGLQSIRGYTTATKDRYTNIKGVYVDGVMLIDYSSTLITAINEATPSITVDGGTWTPGDVVTGPATTPATGTVASVDPANYTITLADSDEASPKRWIANQGKFVKGPPSPSKDAAPDASGLELFSSAFTSTPAGALGQTGASWQVAAYDDVNFSSPIAQELESTTDLTQWPVVPELAEDTKYRCRVRHISLDLDSEWSEPSTFKTNV